MKNKTLFKTISSTVLLLTGVSLFADTLLPSQVYKLAIENSSKIKSKQLQFKSKSEDLNQVRAQYYPQADLTIDYNKTRFERNDQVFTMTPKFEETSLDYTVSVRQKIYDRELYTKLQIEKERTKLNDLELQREMQKLSTDVFNVYLAALGSKNRIHFLNSLVEYNRQKYESIEKKFKLKLSNKTDLLQSKVDLEKSKIELNKEQKLYELYFVKLKRYTLKDDMKIPVFDIENFSFNEIFDKKDFLEEDTLEQNLQVLQSKKGLEINSLEIKNARNSYYPKVDLDARYVKYVSNDTTSDYENMGRVSLKVTMPLYKGGARASKIKSLQLMQKAYKEDLENVKEELQLRNDELKTTILTTSDSIELFKEALVSAQSYLDFVTLGHENGLKSIVDLYEAKNKLFEIKYTYINTIEEFINSYVEFLIVNNKMEEIEKIDKLL